MIQYSYHKYRRWKAVNENMSFEELKQVVIDNYINLIRIKRYQKEVNPELEYQLKTQKNKLHQMGVNTDDFLYEDNNNNSNSNNN